MTDRELMQEALDALTYVGDKEIYSDTIDALRARLALPEQKPVVWRYRGNLHEFDPSDWASGEVTPLYTAPPQREWVGLNDEELEFYTEELGQGELGRGVLRAVVDFLKEKNT